MSSVYMGFWFLYIYFFNPQLKKDFQLISRLIPIPGLLSNLLLGKHNKKLFLYKQHTTYIHPFTISNTSSSQIPQKPEANAKRIQVSAVTSQGVKVFHRATFKRSENFPEYN